jgi:hypothetical protein
MAVFSTIIRMAFPADSELKTGRSSSKTVMGHWPIESSNLSLSASFVSDLDTGAAR